MLLIWYQGMANEAALIDKEGQGNGSSASFSWEEIQVLWSVLEARVYLSSWGGVACALLCMSVAAFALELCLYSWGILCLLGKSDSN